MNKLIISALLIFGLVGMIGTAAGADDIAPDPITINIATNAIVEGSYFHQGATPVDYFTFEVIDIGNGAPSEIGVRWGNTGTFSTTGTISPVTGNQVDGYIETWQIQDATDADDSTQNGNSYLVEWSAYDNYGTLISFTRVGSTTTNVGTEIPEFPIIALPIAAVLGLMFIISSRKKEE